MRMCIQGNAQSPDLLQMGQSISFILCILVPGACVTQDTFCKHLLAECKNEHLDEMSKNLIQKARGSVIQYPNSSSDSKQTCLTILAPSFTCCVNLGKSFCITQALISTFETEELGQMACNVFFNSNFLKFQNFGNLATEIPRQHRVKYQNCFIEIPTSEVQRRKRMNGEIFLKGKENIKQTFSITCQDLLHKPCIQK